MRELIKQVGKYEIALSEDNECKFNLKKFFVGISIITLISISIIIFVEYYGRDCSIYYGIVMWVSLTVFSLSMCIYDDIIISYYISSGCYDVKGIYVKKENPKVDQIEVCKAAKKIETELLKIVSHEDEIKSIASNCR